MARKIITGDTGSGKTYHATHTAKEPFVYAAPCRQLVYETYIETALKDKDCLSTGEVHLQGQGGNAFVVYEALIHLDFAAYKTLIVDEVHYLSDKDRGGDLHDAVKKAEKLGIDIILVTATDNLDRRSYKGYAHTHLPPWKVPPRQVKVTFETFRDNLEKGMSSLLFFSKIRDAVNWASYYRSEGYKAVSVTGVTSPDLRLISQYAYRRGGPDSMLYQRAGAGS